MTLRFATALATGALAATLSTPLAAQDVYLNDTNITVQLGPTTPAIPANPFANLGVTQSLANVINAPSAIASEFHSSPTTHVWVSGAALELRFDFGIEYDLSTLHLWNYHSENFDVDDIDFTFFDGSNSLVGSLLNVAPLLGNGNGSDATPIFAQDYALSFPSRVRYVNAVLSGSNNQVDFNNLGFTARVSVPAIPEPETYALMLAGLGLLGVAARRRTRAAR